MKRIVQLSLPVAILALISATATAQTSYSTGFEDFTLGPISSGGTMQGGWSGGAQADLTNSDVGDEQIVNTVAHTGAQSWHYARGYNSPGQGTAFTPSLSASVSNVGDSMTGSIWFKAHTAGDGSLLALETGNNAGTDRAEILAYIDNVAGGITVRSFTGAAFTPVSIVTGLNASDWHELSFSLELTALGNQLAISVDGSAPVTFAGSLDPWRDVNAPGYSESSRLKLRPRHADGDPQFNGFYMDDINYAVTAVPEPTTLGLLSVLGLSLLARRRSNVA